MQSRQKTAYPLADSNVYVTGRGRGKSQSASVALAWVNKISTAYCAAHI